MTKKKESNTVINMGYKGAMKMKKILILYYSYSGNTRRIAEMIQKETGADIAEIRPVTPYTGSYNDVVEQGEQEVKSGFMPPVEPISVNVREYDKIILGTPVWWYRLAPVVKSFLHNTNLRGKDIYPFFTKGGWEGHAQKDIQKECNGCVHIGFSIKFEEDVLETPESEIRAWIAKVQAAR